ncbi:MAG: hypothetical protein ACOCUS_00925 [Polyangiales bacterium]
MEEIVALAEDSGDLAAFRERLEQLAEAEADADLVETLERAGFSAQLWGRWRQEISRQRQGIDADGDDD